jgi:hypothetical protein
VISIRVVPPERVYELWDLTEPFISKSFGLNPYPIDPLAILADILHREKQLWVVYDEAGHLVGAFTTSITDQYGNTVGTVEHLGGVRFDEWATQMLLQLEEWAKDIGVKYLQSPGRRGWEKYTKPLGYNSDIVLFKKEI